MTLDSEEHAGLYTSLALDEAGRHAISYCSYNYDCDSHSNCHSFCDDLKFARYDGESWQTETVDDEENVGWYTSLALDGMDRPHISYYANYPNHELKYAWHDGFTWQIETVDREGHVGQYTSLVIDEADRPHISYYDASNGDLKYTWHNGDGWQIETVDVNGYVGLYTSLALDGAGQPHISYHDATNYDLKYAWRDGTEWHIETVDSEGGLHTSLALDGMDRPHISHYDRYPNYDLKYAWRDETIWHIETVDGDEYMHYYYASLALDRVGRPHISYCELNPFIIYSPRYCTKLKYAWRDGVTWHVEIVDDKGYAGGFTSLALDRAGRPYISYNDSSNHNLKQAWLATPLPLLNKQSSTNDYVHYDDTLTYTLTTFFDSGSGVRLWDSLSPILNYVPGSITGIATPTAVYSPTVHAIVWQGTLSTNTVQTVSFRVTPDITVTKALSSPLPIVNTAWLTDTESGTIITDTAIVNLMPLPLSLNKQATLSGDLRNNDTLTYSLTLYGPGLQVRLRDPLPPSVSYVPGSITDTIGIISGTLTLPAAVYSPTAHAILWQGTLPTDTVEVIRFQVTPGITGTGSMSMSLPIVNTAWMTATESGRRVSSTVIVNGDYVYVPLILRQLW
ncbi:MAG: hypothetical protein GY832_22530 [Chloroflexi bacterium]|nr:hypothetical protein [Chloroflexota bacterium]